MNSLSDDEREDMIETVSIRFMSLPVADVEGRRRAWAELRELINGRSEARVRQMEKDRGLR